MARTVSKVGARFYSHRRVEYDRWFNGRTWSLKPGVDYQVSLVNFRACLYAAAKKRGKKVQTRFYRGRLLVTSV